MGQATFTANLGAMLALLFVAGLVSPAQALNTGVPGSIFHPCSIPLVIFLLAISLTHAVLFVL